MKIRVACPHCWPAKNTHHFQYHLEYYIERFYLSYPRLMSRLWRRLFPKKKTLQFGSIVWGWIYAVLEKTGLLTLSDNPPEHLMFNRSSLFFHEAKKRGLPIKAVVIRNRSADEFEVTIGSKKYYYQGVPLTIHSTEQEIDDKHTVKNILGRHGIPVPEGRGFTSGQRAVTFGRALGFPLVVKPSGGSLSRHLTVNIRDEQQLLAAIRLAKKYRPDFMVERFIPGPMFRATVIGQQEVFVCQKVPANVIGDGRSTIEQLIQQKNTDPRRGPTEQRNTTLHRIPIDQHLLQKLKQQNLTLESIPQNGQKIFLQNKFILSQGCDIINFTEKTHPDNTQLFRRVSQIFDADLIGIDAIFQDIATSYREQNMGILETNSLPYIDMHAIPSHGPADPVAEKVWDLVLEKIKK